MFTSGVPVCSVSPVAVQLSYKHIYPNCGILPQRNTVAALLGNNHLPHKSVVLEKSHCLYV